MLLCILNHIWAYLALIYYVKYNKHNKHNKPNKHQPTKFINEYAYILLAALAKWISCDSGILYTDDTECPISRSEQFHNRRNCDRFEETRQNSPKLQFRINATIKI